MDVIPIFGLSGLIMVLGFLSHYFFKKTGIPDILILLFIGLLIGPFFKLINPSVFLKASELFSSLALMILLFEGGMNLNLYRVMQESPRAFLLAVFGIITSMILTAIFVYNVLGWGLLNGLLLGAIIGGSSSSIVIPLATKLKVSPKISTFLSLESAFTDAICVIVGITIIQLLATSGVGNGLYTITHGIASEFSIGAVLGMIVGLIWLKVLRAVRGKNYDDILTLSAVLLLYAAVESVGGNGAISALIFGLVLGNGIQISKIFRSKEPTGVTYTMKKFHSEISFLIRTFFFVYLGMIVVINNINIVFYSILLCALLFFGRIASVIVATIKDEELKNNRDLISVMVPRGLAAAVLSQLPIVYGLENAEVFPDIAFTVIMVTAVICTFGVFITSRNKTRVKEGTKNEHKKNS